MADYIDRLKYIISVEDQAATKALGGIGKAVIGIGAAYLTWKVGLDIAEKAIAKSAEMEATMKSLRAVTEATGRDYAKVIEAMAGQIGGLASKSVIASGFLKGMTTELDVSQIDGLTTSIRNATIAMGEDFQSQFPLIIKAIKQLNPAILDNIGVTVRLDQVNKKIREGYYGVSKEINEATQQNAIYQEILRQTAKYQGQEAELLETTKGKYYALKAGADDMYVSLGNLITQSSMVTSGLDAMLGVVKGLDTFFSSFADESIESFMATSQAMSEQNDRSLEMSERYDTLAAKISLSAGEQSELNILLRDLADIHPDIVTGWNDAGEAIDISTSALRRNIEIQKAIQTIQFAEHLNKLDEAYDDLIDNESKLPAVIRANLAAFVEQRDAYKEELAALTAIGDTSSEVYKRAQYGVDSWTQTIEENVKTLQETDAALITLQTQGSAMLPGLIEGTEQWKLATQILGDEFVRMIAAYQKGLEIADDLGSSEAQTHAEALEAIRDKISALHEAQEKAIAYGETVREALGIEIPTPDYGDEEAVEEEGDRIQSRADLIETTYDRMKTVIASYRQTTLSSETDIAAYRTAKAIEAGRISKAQANAFMTHELAKLKTARTVADGINSAMNNAMSRITDRILEGKSQFKDIWQEMGKEFVKYFVQVALMAVTGPGGLVAGLVGAIGSIFDTRANDLVAMEQGRHVIQFMAEGMRAELDDRNLGGMIAGNLATGDYAPLSGDQTGGQTIQIFQMQPGGSESEELLQSTANKLVAMAQAGDVPLVTEEKLAEMLGVSGGVNYGN